MLADILRFISYELMMGFGIYSIIKLLVNQVFKIKKRNDSFDNTAVGVALVLGWFTGLSWLLLYLSNENFRPINLVQPGIWIGLSLILSLKRFRRNLVLRLIYSFSFVLTVELFVILTTSLHRDYKLSEPWTETIGIELLIAGLIIKLLEFAVLVAFVDWLRRKLSNKTNNNKPI